MDAIQEVSPGQVAGWGGFESFYDRVVEQAPPGSSLVEVGVFCGKTLIHLAKAAKRADKGLKVYGVDTFQGSPEFAGRVWFGDKPFAECHPATIMAECFTQLINHDVQDDVTLIVSDSAKAADLFYAQSVFMVFIDAAHDFESVMRDIHAWSPKVERGGYIAGDDIEVFPTVKQAVTECFGTEYESPGSWWEKRYL
jgi:hypothetical protein